MDQGTVKRWLGGAVLLVGVSPLDAHPHAWVDQQAILSLDRPSAVIEYRVVPSFKDGTHMFDHLDANHDGVMSDGEKRAYAAALLRSTRMTVDGRPMLLRPVSVSIPTRAAMAGGVGLIAVKATAPLQLSARRSHTVALNIGFALFKKGWFIQPFYGKGLTRGTLPNLHRSVGCMAVRISIPKGT